MEKLIFKPITEDIANQKPIELYLLLNANNGSLYYGAVYGGDDYGYFNAFTNNEYTHYLDLKDYEFEIVKKPHPRQNDIDKIFEYFKSDFETNPQLGIELAESQGLLRDVLIQWVKEQTEWIVSNYETKRIELLGLYNNYNKPIYGIRAYSDFKINSIPIILCAHLTYGDTPENLIDNFLDNKKKFIRYAKKPKKYYHLVVNI